MLKILKKTGRRPKLKSNFKKEKHFKMIIQCIVLPRSTQWCCHENYLNLNIVQNCLKSKVNRFKKQEIKK